MRSFSRFIAIITILCFAQIVGAKTLVEKLQDMEMLRNAAPVPLRTVEQSAEALLLEYTLPEEKGLILYQAARVFAQSGQTEPKSTSRYASSALKYPLELSKRLQLYIYWGDAVQLSYPRARGEIPPAARKEAAQVYLAGLKETLQGNVPKERPAVPENNRTVTIIGPETDETRQLKALMQALAAARAKALLENDLIDHRDVLVSQTVELYSRPPLATEELEQLAGETLEDSWLVSELVQKTKDQLNKRQTKSEQRTAKPDGGP